MTWIYALLNLVDELSSAVRKIRIQKHIDRWIRHYNCIPRHIPSIGIPSQLFEVGKHTLKTMLKEASRHIRHPAARAHLLKHTRFHRGMVLRWSKYEQGAKTCKAFTYTQLHPLDQVRSYHAQMRSLLCVCDFWKLPISGSHDLFEEWARSSLRDWARSCRLPTRCSNTLRYVPATCWPAPCVKWTRKESLMRLAVEKTSDEQ